MSKYDRLPKADLVKQLIALQSREATLRKALRADRTKSALQDTEERIRAILQTAVEGIITINERGIVDSMNPAAENIFGYKRAEVIGHNISMLMPSPFRQEHDSYLANYRRTGKAKIIGIGREVLGRRKDGTIFPMDLSVGEMQLAGGRMFTGIVRDITERKKLEKEILEVGDRERRRIGQDLHDDLGQRLTGIELMSEVLEQKLTAQSIPEAGRAREIASHVREAISQTRLLARGLSPVVAGPEGLMSALEELAVKSARMFRIKCWFECSPPVLMHDQAAAVHFYRIAQEAISNAVRHGAATEITVRLRSGNGRIELEILDNGRGFPSKLAAKQGMGLQVMRHRAGIIGGSLSVQPNPDGGARIACSIRAAKAPKVRQP